MGNGLLILLIPDPRCTFDHQRPVTPLSHLIEDYEQNTQESDLTHLPEIFELHDLSKDLDAGDFKTSKKYSEDNFQNRGLHQHVFDRRRLEKMLLFMKLKVHGIKEMGDLHILAVAEKVPTK